MAGSTSSPASSPAPAPDPAPTALRAVLDGLIENTDAASRLASDPLWFVRRYEAAADQEVSAVFASTLAFGRVAGFWPTIRAVLERADLRGGPRRWVETFDEDDETALAPLVHRWTRGSDLALLARAVGGVLGEYGSLAACVEAGDDPQAPTIAPAIEHLVGSLRAHAPDMPRGLRHALPQPSGGSACKRWCMFFRWMVRPNGPGADGVDLGLWDLDPARLVVPLDTHVMRLAGFVGLTRRRDASWRTAVDVTRGLAQLDPADPVRYDFALAHLGISGACKGHFEAETCPKCTLQPACHEGRDARSSR